MSEAIIKGLLENLLTLSEKQTDLVQDFKNDLEDLQTNLSMVNDVFHDAEKRQVTDSDVKHWLMELEDLTFDADNAIDDISNYILSEKQGKEKQGKEKQGKDIEEASNYEKVKPLLSSSSFKFHLKLQVLGNRIKDINMKLKSITPSPDKQVFSVLSIVGPIIQVLLENLFTLSKEQIGLVRYFKDDLKKLQKTLSMVNDVLHDAEKRQFTDSAVKHWLRELEYLVFDADNFIDEINYHVLSKKARATKYKRAKKRVKSFFSPSKLGRRIKAINEGLISIIQQASGFSLQASAQATVSGSDASGSIETDSFTIDPVVYGREHDVSGIVEKLISTTNEQAISVLPIVGMGGVGKTTVAKEVFGDERMISHFGDYRVWVYVSQKFDVRNILKNILTSLTEEEFKFETREDLLKELQQHLRTKRYLLVLDDVWNEDSEMWDGFVNSLKGISSANGCCIIVTSRSERVASMVKTLTVHKLKGLSENDCWSIIKANFNRIGYHFFSEFEIVGKHIARRCKGLPLAAKIVGGLLLEKSKDKWLEMEIYLLSDFGDNQNPISKILNLSFDNLSSPSLKSCFAYCSIFPKGYYIEKQQLIELWIAEGFFEIEHRRSNINMETTGSKIFNLLLRNSLLQVAICDDYENVTHCNMHDLVHDLAFSILHENVIDDVCRYIGYESSGDGLLSIPKGQERYVRTLFFSGKVSNIRFSDFESLRTLTLVSEEGIDELPSSIKELKHLRYLDITETRIRYLSDSIGELYHLQTLRARKEGMLGYLETLPESLSYLISLRHLHVPYKTELPPEIGKLSSLQTLSYFHVGGEKGYGISELGNLKNLKGGLEIRNLEKVCDENEAIWADLLGKTGIYELKLLWDESREGDEANDESVLEGLQPYSNLKMLEIFGFKGKRLPLWEGLNNLVEIKLEECSECEELPMLGHLPHLKSLYLHGLTNVKSIRSSFDGNIDIFGRDTIVFPVLERLELCDMPNLKELEGVYEVVIFPCLQYFKIYKCMQLARAPSDFPCPEELEIDGTESRLALKNIFGIQLTSLTRLTIKQIEGLECLPDWLFTNNNNLTWLNISDCPNMTHLVRHLGDGEALFLLRELEIWNCPSLRELPDDLHRLSSLEKLSINGCPNLKSISSRGGGQQQGFTSVRDLNIWDCEALTSLPIEMLESCALSLESLTLSELSSINNFSIVIGCLHKMTRLISLVIERVPMFSIKNTLNGSLSLQCLEIGPFSSDSSNVSFNETVGDMLLQCISLRRLTLKGMEHWDCLPDQLQHLTSLEILDLRNFGIEALPEWFGNLSFLEILYMSNCKRLRHLPEWFGKLSSLKELHFSKCKKLSHLPSKIAMQNLSKLTYFEIRECPLLLKEKRSNNGDDDDEVPQIVDSEWSKISHIQKVYVDPLKMQEMWPGF
ncbi:hypothetical protein CASFOL_012928 [Castilleja foliolosa]|uniref:Uncharacterized protein n=1 Tax=Castilleja foliolosa TaxID=1961234 RepID=A0ABD3DIL9_9LAMI